MINKRLINMVSQSKKYIVLNVVFQWVSLATNIIMIFAITFMLQKLYFGNADIKTFLITFTVIVITTCIRFICSNVAAKMGFISSKAVKGELREKIYKKLVRIGASYNENVSTSEIVQVSVEGVEQLESYFGAYLPQFFYSMIGPLTLFLVLSFVNLPSAAVLFFGVPLIPITIAAVQTFAKKMLSKYWEQYTTLGDTFLENLQGLTTLKIYQADNFKNEEMNRESEKFRKITMKVLSMQLNSITIMDVIAYGGAALGIIMSVTQYKMGHVNLAGCLCIILLSAEFFIPMRQLGSFFHVAMNGMAASDKIFNLLDFPEDNSSIKKEFPQDYSIQCTNLRFSYEKEREILHGINLCFEKNGLVAIVGESGCGKSTIASILMGRSKGYKGDVKIGGIQLSDISNEDIVKNITYVSHQSYLFKGTVRENLLMGNPKAHDEKLWNVLKDVKLALFLKSQEGLDTKLSENGNNLSGGQRQRLALARSILHDTPIYIFDEATSNIDVESENEILTQIYALCKYKMVIMITHRLSNVIGAENIYVLEDGEVKECGEHNNLVKGKGVYANLWNTQSELENYGKQVEQ